MFSADIDFNSLRKRANLKPGHEISLSLFATGGFSLDAESVNNATVCSTSALSQPLTFNGCKFENK